jgi:cytochrome c peroxidase
MYTTRNKIIIVQHGVIFMLCVLLISCKNDEHQQPIAKTPEPVEIIVPSNFPQPFYDLQNNPPTKEGVALGKRLFYDARLSRNNTISCGSCHLQPSAFTHHGHDVSHGIDDQLGRRNSLPIQNLLFYSTFFWDGGVHNLDLVALNAISNKVEMDEAPENILNKLKADEKYPAQFKGAFGSDEITNTHFLHALAQFLATMVSANSRYDLHVRDEAKLMTTVELEGLELFKKNCASCHATDLFTDQSYRNNGFSTEADLLRDQGRAEITLSQKDIGKFKVPSLRNVEYSGPYMHNGKLSTLEEVLNFYTDGVNETSTLDQLLKTPDGPGLKLTEDEKKKVIAFLKTLTDEQYLSDRSFSEF